MEPIIVVHIDWSRLAAWIAYRVLWLAYFVSDGFSDDMGPDMGKLYALLGAVNISVLTVSIGLMINDDMSLIQASALFLILYSFLGYGTSFLVSRSGMSDGILPPA